MNCPNCNAENKEDTIYCTACGERLKPLLEPMKTVTDTDVTISAIETAMTTPAAPEKAPACMECGRQDETLRAVSFPFVISLLIMTNRRHFGGIWCRKHQNRFLFLASLITSTIGWLGIPFGFIYSPIALFTLAKGGKMPEEMNAKLLIQLADEKEAQRDTEGARKCLEESLKFQEDKNLQIRNRIKRLSAGMDKSRNIGTVLLNMVGLLLSAMGLGALVGIMNYLSTYFFATTFPGEVSIFIVILSWAPLVAFGFIAGLLLFQRIEKTLNNISLTNVPVAVLIATASALVCAYSILQGAGMSDTIYYLLFTSDPLSTLDLIFTIIYGLLISGFAYIQILIQYMSTANLIYISIVLLLTGYYLGFATQTGIDTAKWQQKLAE